jgi:cytochrome d ubiquinol oxidase subunit II
VAERWFSFPNIVFLSPVPLLVLAAIIVLLRSLRGNPHRVPFLMSLGLVYLGYTGMAISIWPHIVPPTITIWEAASSPSSHGFLLVGTLFIIPFILMYTAWSYWVFRGKVRHGEGYH